MPPMASKAPITRKSRPAAGAVAVAACLFDAAGLQDAGAAPAGRVLTQITPAGDFGPSDGRALDVPAWRVDAAIAARVIAAHNPAQPLVIDYEHQTLHAESNGQPAPAAGWIHALRWIDGRTAGKVVAQAVLGDDLYAITHPEWWPMVDARNERIHADFTKYPPILG